MSVRSIQLATPTCAFHVALQAYAAKLARLNELHEAHVPLPRVEVRYENLRYELQLTQRAAGRKIKTVGSSLLDCAKTPLTIARALSNKLSGKTVGKTPFTVLDDVSGVLKPGTLSLVLSPPGHGKTSFLRALAQRIPAKALQGSITYNGCVEGFPVPLAAAVLPGQ